MADDEPLHESTLASRIKVVEAFADVSERFVAVVDLDAKTAWNDLRLMAVNASVRRQQQGIRAAILLARNGLGQLAVAFVRTALEDVMWLGFLSTLERRPSQRLFLLMSQWDGYRSLLAQREHLGDEVMTELFFTSAFLDASQAQRDVVKQELKELKKEYNWPGGMLPSGDWIAARAGKTELYNYLHSATSRAVHFSAGEVMRRCWTNADGRITTDREDFQEHLAAFALDQLPRLLMETFDVVGQPLVDAGITSDDALDFESEVMPATAAALGFGRVPLVHPREYNLRPNGRSSYDAPLPDLGLGGCAGGSDERPARGPQQN